jgi:flagellin
VGNFSINTNVASLEAQNYLRINSNFQDQTIQEVTSGLRIVNSGNDAAGLAIANSYAASEAVLTQGIQNANNGLSQLQIIDGGMNNISQLLDRASTLATESATGTFTGDRNVLNSEFQSVITEINREAQSIGLNTGGTFARAMSVVIGGGQGPTGAAAIQNGSISVDLSQSTVDAKSLGLEGVQASGVAGTDIGDGSSTSVAQILANNTPSPGNATNFYISGPGFSGAKRIDVQVDLSSVTDAETLVTAVNDAIQNAGNAVSASATAFKNAQITAAVNTDSQGREQLTFSSSSTAFQVSAGDQTANALMGNFGAQAVLTGSDTSNDYSTTGPADDYLTLSFDGGPAMSFSIGVVANQTAAQIAGLLNGNSDFSANAVASTNLTTNQLIISSANDAAGSSIAVTSSPLSQALGLSGTATVNPAIGKSMAQSLVVSQGTNDGSLSLVGTIVQIRGGGLASPVNITLSDAATDYANAQTDLVAQADTNQALQTAGISVVAGTGTLTFSSNVGQNFSVSASGDVYNELGLGSYQLSGPPGPNATYDYQTITGGDITTGATTDTLEISIAGGTAQQIQVTGFAGDAASDLASLINQQIATNATLSAAGLVASGGGAQGPITLTSTNGTYFRVAEGDGNAADQILGFGSGATGNTLTASGDAGMQTSTPTSQTNDFYFNAGGSSASTVFPFTPIQDGSVAQTVTIAANDSSGGAHSLAVVLSNDSASRDGESLDEAIAAINAQLQQSNDPTLQGIVAVKNQIVNSTGDVTGEGIQFLSALPAFSVTLSAAESGGSPVGIGSSTEQGEVQTSQLLAGGGSANISDQASAESAVTALANAVVALGAAQAVVGRSENQFTYAVNLAQSQLTNFAAAESSIRDADMAAAAANLTKAQILVQAGVAALAQANSAPEQVLTLLKQ